MEHLKQRAALFKLSTKALYGTSKVNVLVSSYVLGCNLDSILYVKKSRSKPCYESSIAAFRSFRYLC